MAGRVVRLLWNLCTMMGGGIGGTFTVKFMYHNEWGEGQGDVIEYS